MSTVIFVAEYGRSTNPCASSQSSVADGTDGESAEKLPVQLLRKPGLFDVGDETFQGQADGCAGPRRGKDEGRIHAGKAQLWNAAFSTLCDSGQRKVQPRGRNRLKFVDRIEGIARRGGRQVEVEQRVSLSD